MLSENKSLFEKAIELGINFNTPFDFTAVDLLEEQKNPACKIVSLELIDLALVYRLSILVKCHVIRLN
jgi:N-acetylneuraminate synthase